MNQQRENWGSRLGVILAVAGSAVGLGNFLVFPGRVAENGGGAFLIPYFTAFILIGIPLAWMEWSLGRRGGKIGHGTGPGILNTVVDHPAAKYLGSLGIIGPLLIFFFYIYIESWLLGFIWYSVTGDLSRAAVNAETSAAFFGAYLDGSKTIASVPAHFLFFLITFFMNFGIIWFGIRRGIENSAKILMPLLLVLGGVLAVRVLMLPGIDKGLGFLWNPDFSKLLDVDVWFSAATQIFFTLSVGIGVILTYASYVKPKQDIALSSLTAAGTNELVEVILGGTIVIPAAIALLGAAASEDVAKAGVVNLGFITMPLIFAKMGAAAYLFQLFWFVLLFIAGLTSSVSILQPGISFLEDELRMNRKSSIAVLGVVTMFFSLLVIWGFNAGAADEIDLWGFQFSLLLFGTIEAVIFSWILGVDEGVHDLMEGAEIAIPKIFLFIMKYITPSFLVILLVLWLTNGSGMDKILLKGVESVPVTLWGGVQTTNITFIWCFRISLLLLFAALNLTIFTAWRNRNGLQLTEVPDGIN